MALRSTLKSIKAMRLTLMAGALLLAALAATPASNLALAAPLQQSALTLVNEDEEFIKRHDDGDFEAKPIFSANLTWAGYGVKDPVTGEWLTALYFIQDDPTRRTGAGSTTSTTPSTTSSPSWTRTGRTPSSSTQATSMSSTTSRSSSPPMKVRGCGTGC